MTDPVKLVSRDAQRHAEVVDLLEQRLERVKHDPGVVDVFGVVVRDNGDWSHFVSGGAEVTGMIGRIECVKHELLRKFEDEWIHSPTPPMDPAS